MATGRLGGDAVCGWHGSITAFLASDERGWLADMDGHHRTCMLEPSSPQQVSAWRHCFHILQEQGSILARDHAAGPWSFIFEYELPRERGRRPDVVVLADDVVIVLEFKDYATIQQAHVDQVAAYARDLRHYHAASHGRRVIPVLVPTGWRETSQQRDDVWISGPAHLASLLAHLVLNPADQVAGGRIAVEAWLASDYAPLPSLVAAARTIFRHESLPQIRRAQSAGIPQALDALVAAAKEARTKGERHLALVTGVPGAGKTLVGLQLVYSTHFDEASSADADGGSSSRAAVFLSGNGPLVKVLQHALKSPVFVQDVHGFLKQYGGGRAALPEEHIWVYDEAQRAWDAERVHEKRGHDASEPEDFLRLGERMNGWALMVGLIGEGQEIHLGEEAGLAQWNDALGCMRLPWAVHCPGKVAGMFTAANRVEVNDALDLTVSLRSHLAEDVQRWAGLILEGELDRASVVAEGIRAQGFDLYATRDLAAAQAYARERYAGERDKRYGLLASSKAKNLPAHGVRNDYNFTKNLREGPWYNDPPDALGSCCQLRDVATEFACQGLELDLPIVAWGDDLTWRQGQGRWASLPQPRSQARDPHRLRLNSYRVLLTRGRDGFVVFVPPEAAMHSTYDALRAAGARVLS